MLLLIVNLFQISTDGGLAGVTEVAPMVLEHMAEELGWNWRWSR